MSLWLLLAVNSITLGGLLFLLAAGFSLIFGLMRIPNLAHGSFFMLGAYFAVSLIRLGMAFWPAALLAGLGAGVAVGILDTTFTSYVTWSAGWRLAYGVSAVVSGIVVAGLLSWLAVRALARTGVLAPFAAGREAREV